jgi:hypothetical protein
MKDRDARIMRQNAPRRDDPAGLRLGAARESLEGASSLWHSESPSRELALPGSGTTVQVRVERWCRRRHWQRRHRPNVAGRGGLRRLA